MVHPPVRGEATCDVLDDRDGSDLITTTGEEPGAAVAGKRPDYLRDGELVKSYGRCSYVADSGARGHLLGGATDWDDACGLSDHTAGCALRTTVRPGRTWHGFHGCFEVVSGSLVGVGAEPGDGPDTPMLWVENAMYGRPYILHKPDAVPWHFSVMSYMYSWGVKVIPTAGGPDEILDYQRFAVDPIYETALDEVIGLSTDAAPGVLDTYEMRFPWQGTNGAADQDWWPSRFPHRDPEDDSLWCTAADCGGAGQGPCPTPGLSSYLDWDGDCQITIGSTVAHDFFADGELWPVYLGSPDDYRYEPHPGSLNEWENLILHTRGYYDEAYAPGPDEGPPDLTKQEQAVLDELPEQVRFRALRYLRTPIPNEGNYEDTDCP